MRLLLAIAGAVLLAACASAPVERASSRLPATDRDPLPFTPAPEVEGQTDRTVALAAAGGEDQARQMLPVLLRAMRDADRSQLEAILAEQIVEQQGHAEPELQSRGNVVERILAFARRSTLAPDVEVEQLVDLGSVTVVRAAQHWPAGNLPPGLRGTDLVVEVRVLEHGAQPLGLLLRWRSRGSLVVRPGREPLIVAW